MNIQEKNTSRNIEFNGYTMKEFIDSDGVIWRNFPNTKTFISANGYIQYPNNTVAKFEKRKENLYLYGICFVAIPDEFKYLCKLGLRIKCNKKDLSTCKWVNNNSTNSRGKIGGNKK